MMGAPNKSLQVTFDPPPTFAIAKAGVASNAPELKCWAANADFACNVNLGQIQLGNKNEKMAA